MPRFWQPVASVLAGGTGWFSMPSVQSSAKWLAIRVRVEGAAALNRPRFLVEGQGAVFRVPTAAGAAFLGGEVLFL